MPKPAACLLIDCDSRATCSLSRIHWQLAGTSSAVLVDLIQYSFKPFIRRFIECLKIGIYIYLLSSSFPLL